MAKSVDLSHCDKGETVTTGPEHLQNCSSCGVFLVCSGQDLSKVVQGRRSGEPTTGPWRPRLTDAGGE